MGNSRVRTSDELCRWEACEGCNCSRGRRIAHGGKYRHAALALSHCKITGCASGGPVHGKPGNQRRRAVLGISAQISCRNGVAIARIRSFRPQLCLTRSPDHVEWIEGDHRSRWLFVRHSQRVVALRGVTDCALGPHSAELRRIVSAKESRHVSSITEKEREHHHQR